MGEVAAGRSDIGLRNMWRLLMIAAIVRIAWKFQLTRTFRLLRLHLCAAIQRRNLRQRSQVVGCLHRRHQRWPLQVIEGGHRLHRGWPLQAIEGGHLLRRGLLLHRAENGHRRHQGWPLQAAEGHRHRSAVSAAGHLHRSPSSEEGLRRRFRRMAPVIACRLRKPTSCVPSWA